jgi:hypothetical protein
VILKYTPDEARSLKAYGEIPESAKINDADPGENEDDIITFDDFDGEDDEIDDVRYSYSYMYFHSALLKPIRFSSDKCKIHYRMYRSNLISESMFSVK